MGHSHGHSHHHVHQNLSGVGRAFIIGITMNGLYVFIELWYGFRIDSTALISDAVHNLSDISSLLLAFFAIQLQKIKTGKRFTYGLRKSSVLASFINSIVLAVAVGIILWEGVERILKPREIPGNVVMIVAGIGIVINFLSAMLFHSRQKHDLNVKAAYWHLIGDALVSLGVVISGVVLYFFKWNLIDGITTVLVAIVILYSTWGLFRDSVIAVMDGVPAGIELDKIKTHLEEIKGVMNIHHLHIWSMSTNENALTCHVKLSPGANATEAKQGIKQELREHGISHVTLEIEQDGDPCLN